MGDFILEISRGISNGHSTEASLAETLGDPIDETPFCELINCFVTRKRWLVSFCKSLLNVSFSRHTEETAKDLLATVENLQLPTPSQMDKKLHGNELLEYRLLYARWLLYCDFPRKCETLPHYAPTKVFGKSFASLIGPMLALRLQKVNTQEAHQAALLLQDFLDYLLYSRISSTKKKKIIRFYDGNDLLEGCTLTDCDLNSSNDSAEANGIMNGTPMSPPSPQRKNSSPISPKSRKNTQNSTDSETHHHPVSNSPPASSKFVRPLSPGALRSAFKQIRLDDHAPAREEGKRFIQLDETK
jgi:hypothetical protein